MSRSAPPRRSIWKPIFSASFRRPRVLPKTKSGYRGVRVTDRDSAMDEGEMSDSLMETVLVQIACASKDILLPMSNRKRRT